MYDMRLRLRELMAAQKPPLRTAYALVKASKGAITASTAHRLLDPENPPARVDFNTLDAICDTLKCDPSQLLERDRKPARR